MKSGYALKKLKVTYIYCSPHFLFGEKMLLNSVLISVKVICCFQGIGEIIPNNWSYIGNIF